MDNVPFEVEHIHPKSKGGSDRVSNLTIACHDCNQAESNQPVEQFLNVKKTELLRHVLAQAKAPLKDATAVNTTRWELHLRLQNLLQQIVMIAPGGYEGSNSKAFIWRVSSLSKACFVESTFQFEVIFVVKVFFYLFLTP